MSLAAALAACTTPAQRNELRGQVYDCAEPDSAACAAAREGFQVVRYPTMTADRLAAASSRALGDLNFDTERDDEQHKVSGSYFFNAPVHAKQLDELFRKTVKTYLQGQDGAALTARVEVLALPDHDVGASVRLRLFLATQGGTPAPLDSVGPYQIFFRQLGIELGATPAPLEDEDDRKKQKQRMAPVINGF